MSIRSVGKADLATRGIRWEINEKSGLFDPCRPARNNRVTRYEDLLGVNSYAGGVSLHLPDGVTVGTTSSLKEVLAHVAHATPQSLETLPVVITAVTYIDRGTGAVPMAEKKRHFLDGRSAHEILESNAEAFTPRKSRPQAMSAKP